MKFRQAIQLSIFNEMLTNPSIIFLGEGARSKVQADFPLMLEKFSDRVFSLPISEDGNIDLALGASLLGAIPVIDLGFCDLLLRAMDSIVNEVAKTNFVSNGSQAAHVVIKTDNNEPDAPYTGQRVESFFSHVLGLNVVTPSCPYDAKGLMTTALRTDAPTLFFEDRMIDTDQEVPERDYSLPFGRASCYGTGRITVVSYASMVPLCIGLQEKGEIDCQVVDLRTLQPLDYPTIFESVKRTRRLLVVEPDIVFGGIGAEIATRVQERFHGILDAPVMRVGLDSCHIPGSKQKRSTIQVKDEQIIEAASGLLS